MHRLTTKAVVLVIALVCGTWKAAADPNAGTADDPLRTASSPLFLLAPPKQDGPVVVRAAFELHDIHEINDVALTERMRRSFRATTSSMNSRRVGIRRCFW
jgi:hypothetical protein